MVFSNSFSKMIAELRDDCEVSNVLYCHRGDLKNDELDYITMRGSMISYLPAGREHMTNDDGRWRREGRQEGKPARIIQKVIPQYMYDDFSINDSKLEKFTNAIRSYVMANGDGEGGDSDKVSLFVCNGDLIPLYYDGENYSEYAGGNLSNSCMRGMNPETFDIYRRNPDKVSMIVALDSVHRVLGRALLWKTDNIGLCMDTIYGKDEIRPMFIKFARENGIRYKASQSCHHHSFEMLDGESTIEGDYASVTLRHWDFDEYPYMDSLYYLDGSVISNRRPDGQYRELRSTDGTYEELNEEVEDVINGDYIRECDGTHVDYRYDGCSYSGYTECPTNYVDEVGSNVYVDHCIYIGNTYYMLDSSSIVYVEKYSEYYHIDDIVYDNNGEPIHCDDAVHTIDGDWVCIDDAVETSDGWLLECDCENIYGEWVRKGNNQNQEA